VINTRAEERYGIKTSVCKKERVAAKLTKPLLLLLPSIQTNLVLTNILF
jgi:hypothetical protein